jgi:hypothetical protein
MAAATFTQLPRELRDMIWSAAALAQYQQVSTYDCSLATTPYIGIPTNTIIVCKVHKQQS